MTYRELLEIIRKLKDSQLDQDVTLHFLSANEIAGGVSCYISDDEEDRLDPGHLVLTIEEE